jgi:hypothetical protein
MHDVIAAWADRLRRDRVPGPVLALGQQHIRSVRHSTSERR